MVIPSPRPRCSRPLAIRHHHHRAVPSHCAIHPYGMSRINVSKCVGMMGIMELKPEYVHHCESYITDSNAMNDGPTVIENAEGTSVIASSAPQRWEEKHPPHHQTSKQREKLPPSPAEPQTQTLTRSNEPIPCPMTRNRETNVLSSCRKRKRRERIKNKE